MASARRRGSGRGRPVDLPRNVVRHHGGFRVVLQVEHRTVRSQTFDTVAEAEREAERLRADAGKLRRLAADPDRLREPPTIATAMEQLRRQQQAKGVRQGSVDFTEQKFKKLCDAWPSSTHLHRIGAPQIERYMAKRREQAAGAQTIHHEVALLKRLFAFGLRHGLLLGSPFDNNGVQMPSIRNKRFDFLTREQIASMLERIRAAADQVPTATWDADVLEFLFHTGLRRGELARLRSEDVDPFRGHVKIAGKKADETRPLAEATRAIASRLVAGADPHGFLIPSANNREQDRANAITKIFARWKKRLGLRLHGSVHVLRHSFCTALVQVPGMPFATVQRAMRHATPAMTMRYYHESGEEMRAAAEAVATGVLPKTTKARAQKPARRRRADLPAAHPVLEQAGG